MGPEPPIIPANNLEHDRRVLPNVRALGRPADAKETAIAYLSAALLFTSLAVLALVSDR
jgi:hypothetical protein